ncbi:hypothetical protein [Sorangium cellulosum]|uniref:hypothetical protein n=1 Tax=Sorangium cellulosum TaxID=56 RepID=UPI001F4147AA|nr:hypothetical protein [Sorangium cellulosum]
MEKAGPRTQEGIVTWLDEIERRGERKGERRGERKGRVKSLLQQLAARFGAVPASVTARVEAASERDLERWTIRVLTAPTPEAVLDDAGAKSPRLRSERKPAARKRSPGAKAVGRTTRTDPSRPG